MSAEHVAAKQEDLEAIPLTKAGTPRATNKDGSTRKPWTSRKEAGPGGGPSGAAASGPGGGQKKKAPNPVHEVPQELLQMLATMPEQITAAIINKRTGGMVQLEFSEQSLLMVTKATDVWLKSLDFELSPGWALLGAHAACVGGAFAALSKKLQEEPRASEPAPAPAPKVEPKTDN